VVATHLPRQLAVSSDMYTPIPTDLESGLKAVWGPHTMGYSSQVSGADSTGGNANVNTAQQMTFEGMYGSYGQVPRSSCES
jgi:hypothetical protein